MPDLRYRLLIKVSTMDDLDEYVKRHLPADVTAEAGPKTPADSAVRYATVTFPADYTDSGAITWLNEWYTDPRYGRTAPYPVGTLLYWGRITTDPDVTAAVS